MNLYDPVYKWELRERLLQKIADDWLLRFKHHGAEFTGLSAIRSQNRFVDDVAEVVEQALAAQIGLAEAREMAPSKYFFLRLFFQYRPDTQWQSRNREALCLYVGYPDWETFVESVGEQLVKEPVTITINQIIVRPRWLPVGPEPRWRLEPAEVIEQAPKPLPWRRVFIGLMGLVLLVSLARWGWHRWQNRQFTPEQLAGVGFQLVRVEGQTLVLAYDVRSLGVDSVIVDFGTAGQEYNYRTYAKGENE